MGAKSTKGSSKKQPMKVLVLGISGSGKTTFIKQMKIIHHGGFSSSEIEQYKEIMFNNIIVGMQELIKHASKLEINLNESTLRSARSVLSVPAAEVQWDETVHKKIQTLWADPGIQRVWKDAVHYQLQVNHMEYLMANVERFMKPNFVPSNEDILLARQRTTGAYRTTLKKDKYKWELIDCGGQTPERRKWEEVMSEGLTAVIFFAGLDEYNMVSAEDKSRSKMEVAKSVFADVMNSEMTKGVTKLLFLNKMDIFRKKMEDKQEFQEFQRTFPGFKGNSSSVEAAADFVADSFRDALADSSDHIHHHNVCALDTNAMGAVFEAVKNDIFMKKMEFHLNSNQL